MKNNFLVVIVLFYTMHFFSNDIYGQTSSAGNLNVPVT